MAKKILQNYDFHGNQIIHFRLEPELRQEKSIEGGLQE